MEKETAKWYDKASGRKQRKAENTAKIQAKAELKKQRQEEKDSTEGRKAPLNSNKALGGRKAARKPSSGPATASSVTPMFDRSRIPADAEKILSSFDTIVAETRSLSGKQQTLLAGQIKKLSHQLTDDRSSRRIGYMNDASSISAYISYFMWWNLVRLTRLFANLPKDAFPLKDEDICLDLGSGPLTVPVALWLARPELRSKKLTFYVMDLSQTALAAGEEIYLNIAAKTLSANQEPWKIIRVKGPVGTGIKEKAGLVTSANVFNELAQTNEMPSDYLAKKYTGDIESYFSKQTGDKKEDRPQTVLLIEPGDPHSARLVSLMRDAFIRRGFMPVSPCPHIHSCPMEGRTTSNPSGKWCNFAFDTDDAPANLLKLSEKANLTKERAVLSYVLARRGENNATATTNASAPLRLRVASDFIRLPDLHKSGYYCCSDLGLILAVDKTNIRPSNGDLLSVKRPSSPEKLPRDKKSGAPILEI